MSSVGVSNPENPRVALRTNQCYRTNHLKVAITCANNARLSMKKLLPVASPVFASFFLLLLASSLPARAEKIWTNSASGLWSDGLNWSGHTPPDITAFIRITNDNTKTITIDASTLPANLTVQSLLLNAPPGATNTLLLSSVGIANPLVFQTGLELQDGAA